MLNREINSQQKESLLQALDLSGLEELTFSWQIRKYFWVKRTVLVCDPYKYYFVFDNCKNKLLVKEYFPNWGEQKTNPTSHYVVVLLQHWVDSIRLTLNRSNQIVVPLDLGKDQRAQFNYLSSTLECYQKNE